MKMPTQILLRNYKCTVLPFLWVYSVYVLLCVSVEEGLSNRCERERRGERRGGGGSQYSVILGHSQIDQLY